MSKLPEFLRELVSTPDPRRWYLFPNSGKRRRSRLHQFEIDNGVLLEPRYRRLVETMVGDSEADIRNGRLSYPGLRTDEEWAAIVRCKPATIARYRKEIDKLFSEIGINADTQIFETVEEADFGGTRIRSTVTIVESPTLRLSSLETSLQDVLVSDSYT